MKANIVANDGQIEFGTFHEPIEEVNLIDAKIYPDFPTPKWFRNIRLKEFQAFQGGNQHFFFNIALFNAKVSAFAQIRLFHISTGKHYIYERQLLPTHLKIPNNILNTQNHYISKNLSIQIENKLLEGFIKVKFHASQFKDMPDIEGEVTGHFENAQHMVASIPFASNRGMYAHKSFVAMSGHLSFSSSRYELSKPESFFILDDHKGYYPYVLKWDWLSAGFVKDGIITGISLTKNQSIDNEKYNENALWHNGKLFTLPGVHFERDGNSWTIKDNNGTIHLEFEALYPKNVRINLGPFGKSDYQGPMGRVSGTVKLESGEEVKFNNIFAFAEKQYIRC